MAVYKKTLNGTAEIQSGKKEVFDESNFTEDRLHQRLRNCFYVEFNDESVGEITFSQLHLENKIDELLLDTVRINAYGNAVEISTTDGEIFDIDGEVFRSFVSEESRKKIAAETELTAQTVGEKIRQARKENRVTQNQLSKSTKIDQAIISKVETGKRLPRFDTIERIAKGLNMPISSLLQVDE